MPRVAADDIVHIKLRGEELELLPVGHVDAWLRQRKVKASISRQGLHKAIATGKITAYRSLAIPGRRAVVLVRPNDILDYLAARTA
jgi:hypothetical protein